MASKVPKFGAWENGDVGHTGYFETARKGNSGGPITNPNNIQMNRDVPPPVTPSPNHTKPKPKQKQPKFGAWEGGDDVPYTQIFDIQSKTNPNEPQMNREVGSSRQPKAAPPPPMKPNDHPRPKPQSQVKFVGGEPSVNGQGAPTRPQQRPPASRGPNPGRGGSVPVFGDWNNNPGQAGGYTVVFDKLQEDKKKGNVPSLDNPPRSNRNTPTHPIKQPKQGGCFPRLFK